MAVGGRERPSLGLYGDDTHPNAAGTYLAACVIYRVVARRSPVGSSFTAGLDPTLAVYLQRKSAAAG